MKIVETVLETNTVIIDDEQVDIDVVLSGKHVWFNAYIVGSWGKYVIDRWLAKDSKDYNRELWEFTHSLEGSDEFYNSVRFFYQIDSFLESLYEDDDEDDCENDSEN